MQYRHEDHVFLILARICVTSASFHGASLAPLNTARPPVRASTVFSAVSASLTDRPTVRQY